MKRTKRFIFCFCISHCVFVLTIGDTELYVEREVDWEADPRALTIVYSGLNSDGESLWGKRVSD